MNMMFGFFECRLISSEEAGVALSSSVFLHEKKQEEIKAARMRK